MYQFSVYKKDSQTLKISSDVHSLIKKLDLFGISSAAGKMSRSGDWMCGACQHLNFQKRNACQKCGYPKLGAPIYGFPSQTEVLAGDWYCGETNCSFHNFASRRYCYRCGANKDSLSGPDASQTMASGGPSCHNSSLPGWKNGDWLCNMQGCGSHNYACRTECYKCKAPRDFGYASI